MPTEKEFNAIGTCVMYSYHLLNRNVWFDDEQMQYLKQAIDTAMGYFEKVQKQKALARDRASAWNKEHKERHSEANKASYARRKQLNNKGEQ